MKNVLYCLLLLLLVTPVADATIVTLFADTDTFVSGAKEIVIAKCNTPAPRLGDEPYTSGLCPFDVQVVMTIKGNRTLGKHKIVTIYQLEEGQTYLLMSLGGSAYESDFLAVPQLSVVQLPVRFDLQRLKNKPIKDQVQAVFEARRHENKELRRKLEYEWKLLERSVAK